MIAIVECGRCGVSQEVKAQPGMRFVSHYCFSCAHNAKSRISFFRDDDFIPISPQAQRPTWWDSFFE